MDDSLDVVAAHGLGGTVGALLTGVFAQNAWSGGANGALFGNPVQLGIQAIAVLAAAAYSGAGTYVILRLLGLVMPLRAADRDEGGGLDVSRTAKKRTRAARGRS